MAKAFVLIIGIILTIAGIAEIVWQWESVKTMFWGLIGVMMLAAGILALVIALSELTGSNKNAP